MIEKTNIFVETPLKTRGITIVTVSEVNGEYYYNNNSLGGYCTKHPIALAILTSKGVKAFAVDGNEMEMDSFIHKFPQTRPLLEKRWRQWRTVEVIA